MVLASDAVRVLLGNGDGSFVPGPEYPRMWTMKYVAVRDFNADGIRRASAPYNDITNSISASRSAAESCFTRSRVASASPPCHRMASRTFEARPS